MINKFEKIVEWLSLYTPINDWIFFNVTQVEKGSASVNSISSVNRVEQFINSQDKVEQFFTVTLCKIFDEETSDINLSALQSFQELNKWVKDKNKAKEFPIIDDVIIESIEPVSNSPMVEREANKRIAKYTGQFKLTYIE